MDHISKALERAQSERRSVRDWMVSSSAPRQEAPLTDKVAESAVRRVELSQSHLEARHVLTGAGSEDPYVSDVYRLLRTRVTQLMRQHDWNAVGVTSASPKAGKSLTAINLAIMLARDSNRSVVLVDGDLRRPSIGETLGLADQPGLIDYLTTDLELRDVVVRLNIENLFLLPGRADDEGRAVPELLTEPKMTSLVHTLRGREQSRIVLVDLPPILMGDDVLALAPLLDCLLVVVEEGKTGTEELREAAQLIKGFNLLGTVLNKSAGRKHHFEGYYYHAAGTQGACPPNGDAQDVGAAATTK